MKLKEVYSVKSKSKIDYSFKELTYREFQIVIDMLDAVKDSTRQEKMRTNEVAFCQLVENAEQLLNEASNAAVESVFADAIKFNQGDEPDIEKKSE